MPADVLTKAKNEVTPSFCGSCCTLPDIKFVPPPRCWRKDGKLVNESYCNTKNADKHPTTVRIISEFVFYTFWGVCEDAACSRNRHIFVVRVEDINTLVSLAFF